MGLSISLEQNGDKRILRLKGMINTQTLPTLEKEIEELFSMHHHKVLLDLTNVDSFSVEGLRMLFAKTKRFSLAKGNLGLSNVSPHLMQAIQIAGFDRVLLIYRDEQEALSAMV